MGNIRDLLAPLKVNVAMTSTHSQLFHRKLSEVSDNKLMVFFYFSASRKHLLQEVVKGWKGANYIGYSALRLKFKQFSQFVSNNRRYKVVKI